MGNRASSPP
ncbi:hypothetical protein LINPERPRIM_LOCUS41284 [Linum perenne]